MSYREEFDMYGVPEPAEPWGYNLDDTGIHYGPGDWPFWQVTGGNIVPGLPTTPESREPRDSLRLAPDTVFQSWRQAYVLVYREPKGLSLSFGWAIRPQGMGQHVAYVNVKLDDDCRIRNRRDFTGDALKQVRARVEKFKAFLQQHRESRDRGEKRPVTAHELYQCTTANQS
jgi:hypothetical protein